jgi:dihydrodipicolinate synthase/N-acetylneuraminate lyase
MSSDEIKRVVKVNVEAVNGRMPAVAGTGYNSVIGADIARSVQCAGAASVLVVPTYYTRFNERSRL